MHQFIFDQHKRGEARRGSAGSCLQHYHLKKVCEVECGEYLDILKIKYMFVPFLHICFDAFCIFVTNKYIRWY